jgi:tyrosinase
VSNALATTLFSGVNMRKTTSRSAYNRRDFLVTTAAAAGAAALPPAPALAAATYTRYDATSAQGQAMLSAYATAINAMIKLPADHPHNWFRAAFAHLMDCPHGNWWFYVWHRGFIGYWETVVRKYSGNPKFAFPYWDWTNLPRIPASMFKGVLTPVDNAYLPYTKDLATFTAFIQPAMKKFWNGLSSAQRAQLSIRGYGTFDDMWNDVSGNGVPANGAFAATTKARYLSATSPNLDPNVAYDCTPFIVDKGLVPVKFYDPTVSKSFTSSKTPSHNSPAGSFSVLEGLPHNNVHNNIGGYPAWNPGPFGYMTQFLSPSDPIFFLHHSNMDRLWDVWTRKQQRLHLPILPPEPDLTTLKQEPFLFYIGASGYVGPKTAGDVLSTTVFGYDYGPGGFPPSVALFSARPTAVRTAAALIRGTVSGNSGTVAVPRAALQRQLGAGPQLGGLTLEVTIERPEGPVRQFDVLVNAPAGTTKASAGSPYFAGTIGFFGLAMKGMHSAGATTFAVPIPPTLRALRAPAAAAASSTTLHVQLVPSHGVGEAPVLTALAVGAY